jgi:hypothetical protein
MENGKCEICSLLLPILLVVLVATYAAGGYIGAIENGAPAVWGHKTKAMFDVWALQHVLTGVLIGAIFTESNSIQPSRSWAAGLMTAIYFWEVQEFSGEIGFGMFEIPLPPQVAIWFGGVEHWANRLIADPILVFGGALIGRVIVVKQKDYLLMVIGSLVVAFFVIHLFSPNTMSIQVFLGANLP